MSVSAVGAAISDTDGATVLFPPDAVEVDM